MKKESLKIEIQINSDGTDSIQINGIASAKEIARALISLKQAEESLVKKSPEALLLKNCFETVTVSESDETTREKTHEDIPDSFGEFIKSLLKKDED